MRVAVGMLWLLALWGHPPAHGSCPSQCSCSLHVLGDGSKARTVVCSDPDMTLPPASVPPDTSRLRLERTAIRKVPGEAFRPLGRLEQLWLPYNALSELSGLMLRGLRRLRELRLPGNRLAAFPWAALRDAPQLRLLDLQANRLSAVPPEAARFLGNLTFLDLSSNQLLRLPQELLATWAHLQTGPFLPGHHTRLVLVHQEVASDGTSWTLLGLPAVSHLDSGDYICQAKNFLGISETVISLAVTEPQASTEHGGSPGALWARTGEGAEAAAYNKMVARHVPDIPGPAVLATGPPVSNMKEELTLQHFQMGIPGERSNGQAGRQETQMVRSLKVVGDTYQSVTLVWKAPQAGSITTFSVLYAVFGQRSMRRVVVPPGKTSITIRGLVPKTKYVACVCVRDLVPQKEQCVIFSTDEVVDAEATQRLINVVVISVAVVIALPLTLLVCCGALRRRCRKCRSGGSAEAYVNLERLGHSEDGSEELSQHSLSEADRLLSARSSLDSQVLVGRGGRRINEYFC
ncbi:leucine-rich repeat, immunoglobulin-like domain and transmembrane domain-containing protein 1 isoform X3 [Leopardus geoffroyi]|uniref:leucine-rich repeat, immunoglobulin-like domain and transmembrane domain-containing protein 1 isoform X3 n=1 Tax=Leopardus geoffroyi TaxID=46844 RepID=UPI001E25FAD8|nr:leucine-rich repeat, immunoglobulin-like domain and transmembrane domain-containing protein 1 isoform X3 [Leopardus geoffroyi]